MTHNSTFGNQNYCQFVLASGSISLITSLILGIITLIALCSKGDIVPTFFTVIELICSIFLFVLMLVLGSVASVGFSKTCQSFAASCLTLQEVVEATLNTSTSNLYNNLVIVQSSSWIACGVWAFFLIITIFRVRIYRRKNKNKKTKLVDEEDDSS